MIRKRDNKDELQAALDRASSLERALLASEDARQEAEQDLSGCRETVFDRAVVEDTLYDELTNDSKDLSLAASVTYNAKVALDALDTWREARELAERMAANEADAEREASRAEAEAKALQIESNTRKAEADAREKKGEPR